MSIRPPNPLRLDVGLEGAHVLITGASGGIGLETANRFVDQGSFVTAHYNSNYEPLSNFADSQRQVIQADLTKEDEVSALFQNATCKFGPVQVVVINHGIYDSEEAYLWEMSLDHWKKTMDANLTSSFLVAREYLKRLQTMSPELKEKAAIVFIGSTAGRYGEDGHADYAASKSAMMYGLAMSLKNEIVKLAPLGRVNCIAPGWVNTPMATEWLKDPHMAYSALATTPLKKVAQPSDVAKQVIVLSSNVLSGHVTGQVLMVDGGLEGRVLNTPEDVGLKLPADHADLYLY